MALTRFGESVITVVGIFLLFFVVALLLFVSLNVSDPATRLEKNAIT